MELVAMATKEPIDSCVKVNGRDPEKIAFEKVIKRHRKKTRKMFPTCPEVLQIAKSLGYRKILPPDKTPGFHP